MRVFPIAQTNLAGRCNSTSKEAFVWFHPLSFRKVYSVTTFEALQTLLHCRSHFGDRWLAAQGQDFGLDIDETFVANYEHLLLWLQKELVDALARKVLEELLHPTGGYDKKQRKLLSWFTEFAEKPRPLSTSFPWTIKSSLAVLWGVSLSQNWGTINAC